MLTLLKKVATDLKPIVSRISFFKSCNGSKDQPVYNENVTFATNLK